MWDELKQAVIRILRKVGCAHHWKVWRQTECENELGEQWTKLQLSCLKCGKLKTIRKA